MTIYIVENNISHLEKLKCTIKYFGHTCIGFSRDPLEAEEQIGILRPNVVLLDVHLAEKQLGILLGERIKSLYNIPILFISSDYNKEIISKVANLFPVAYITKPVNEMNLYAALTLAGEQQININQVSSVIFVKTHKKLVKVRVEEILFVHTDSKNYCSIIIANNTKLLVRYSILGLLKLLNHRCIVQTHRSYIINWEKVDSFYESEQTIEISGHHVPVGRFYKENVYRRLKVVV